MKTRKPPTTEIETTSYRPPLKSSLRRPTDVFPEFEIAGSEAIDAHLLAIIRTELNDDPFFSIFLDLSTQESAEAQLRDLVKSVRPVIPEDQLYELFRAESCILDLMGDRLRNEHKGLAFHFRGGKTPVAFAIAFHLPLKPLIVADRMPNIVPLIEMRDAFDRYVVLISTETQARILEIVLGTVTREAWLSRPDLRQRVGREWTREHYRNHRKHRDTSFVREKVEVITELMRKRGYSHLILAGAKDRIAAVERALPPGLRNRIVDICNLNVEDRREKIVRETIGLFVEEEMRESLGTMERLKNALLSSGGAVVGLEGCEKALSLGLVETLVIARNDETEHKRMQVFRHRSPDGNFLTVEKRRERLLNRAVESKVPIEFVRGDSFLDDYYGIGAILRFAAARDYLKTVSGQIMDF